MKRLCREQGQGVRMVRSVTVRTSAGADRSGTPVAAEHTVGDDMCGRAVECDLAAGEELRVDRFVVVHTEREVALPGPSAVRAVRTAQATGFDALLEAHRAAWAQVWELADVEIEGDQDAQVGVRFAAAELIAAAPTESSRSCR